MPSGANKGWNRHTCINYRGSTDSSEYVKGIKVDNEIKYRAGFNIFEDKTKPAKINGQSNRLFTYTITDNGAMALTAGAAIAVASVTQLLF